MKKNIVNRVFHNSLIWILCLFLSASTIQNKVFAEENQSESGLCAHHPYHTEECGYREGSDGAPCTHECKEACYETVVECVMNTSENESEILLTEETEHVCSEESGCIKQIHNCTHVHDENCGYKEAQEASLCTYICTECGSDSKIIASWKWIDPEEFLVWSDELSVWGLGLPGTNADNLLTSDILLDFLPKEIETALQDGTSETFPISWDLSSFPEAGAFLGTYTLSANLPDEISLSENAPALKVVLSLGGASAFADPLLSEEQIKSHIITDALSEISGVQVNLFDYYVSTEYPTAPSGDILKNKETHVRQIPSAWGNTAAYSAADSWWHGINENHLLIFGDGIIHAGLWNKGAGENTDYGKQYAGMEGIVKPLLQNGYPLINTGAARQILTNKNPGEDFYRNYELITDHKLAGDHINSPMSGGAYPNEGADIQNLSNTLITLWENGTGQKIETGTESLAYLFDPSITGPYKKTYQNILGLFQIDDDGYYYYNMRKNFAEFKEEKTVSKNGNSDGRFILYDAPATQRSDGIESSIGNFFPFNKGTEVFNGFKADGTLSSSGINCANNTMNHHLGMTVDVNFRQPINGMINMGNQNSPMTFEFSGDDDVWIFIDDVLVLDLGGVHSEIYGIIDFASGNVLTGQGFRTFGIPDYDSNNPENTEDLISMTTLRKLFRAAGKENAVNWNGDTFASSSDHTLKMFYLERGNYDSSLSLRFNLQPLLYQHIKKVDQNGNPINGVVFELYEAEVSEGNNETVYSIKDETNPLASLTTGKNASNETLDAGTAVFEELDTDGKTYRPFNFADRYKDGGIQYYILKEKTTPPGYRPIPVDIILEYNPDTTMLRVVNRYITGSYSSFISTITGNSKITYGKFETASGVIEPSDITVQADKQKDGLVLAIPMEWQQNFGESGKWIALYGSNTSGLNASIPEARTPVAWRKAVLKAALYQCSDDKDITPSWYLKWNEDTRRLEGILNDLPGRADRYQLNNPTDADMKMVYMMIDPAVFAALNIRETDSEARYEALGAYVRNRLNAGDTMDQIIETIYQIKPNPASADDDFDSRGVSFLNVDQFIRSFRSLIYIPNEQRELRVWKIDQTGLGVNGATFALFDNPECTGTPIASGVTDTIDGLDGTLIFAPYDHTEPGHAKMEWASSSNVEYYLKETAAPEGYNLNPTVVPVIVGIYSIYADAGEADDGVSVMAGVGKLTQPMVKYAADENVNITLRDITAFAQKQSSNTFDLNGWEDSFLEGTQVVRTMNLHYGKNAMIDYGLHDEDGGKNLYPFFVTDTGFIRARVRQNYDALKNQHELNGEKPAYGDSISNNASKDKVEEDITSLFSLLNIVVVTDQKKEETLTGQLVLSKKISGIGLTDENYTQNFDFKITLKDESGNELNDLFYFYGTDKSGYVKSGEVIPFHHDESITILGLPEKTQFTVEELSSQGWTVLPESGKISGEIKANENAHADFINTKITPGMEYGSLEIRKTVEGEQGDKNREFTFTVLLYDENGNELAAAFPYFGSKQGMIRSSETITLKHGESITISSLPVNTRYSVSENEANKDGYVTSSTNTSGTITKNPASASFINKKEAVTKLDPAVDTGDHSSTDASAFLCILSALCLALLTKIKMKRKTC